MRKILWGMLFGAFAISSAWAEATAPPLSSPETQAVSNSAASKKASPWEARIGLGYAFPGSANFSKGYDVGRTFDLGLRYHLTDELSLMLDLNRNLFHWKDGAITSNYDFGVLSIAALAQYHFTNGIVRPYVFAGPGLGLSEFAFSGTLAGVNVMNIAYEADFILVGGAGYDVALNRSLRVYLQGKLAADFTSNAFANWITFDNPSLFFAVEAGLEFPI